MHPSHTLVPRVVNLLARATGARPKALLGAPKLLVEVSDGTAAAAAPVSLSLTRVQHVETHSPTPAPSRRTPFRQAYFGGGAAPAEEQHHHHRHHNRRRLPAPMIAWNDHLRMV